MELLWTAFVLGLVGSLHCAVMCGPLILAVSGSRGAGMSLRASRWVYHSGRIAIYGALGFLFGVVGQTFAMAGLQRWLSITAGVAILAGVILSSRSLLGTPAAKLVAILKTRFGALIQRRSLASQFALGAINGLLPCGLVYIAAAGAAATANPLAGALHMAVFGAGTLPMLLGLGVLAGRVRKLNEVARRVIPASVAVVGLLLLLRGMALGIPYVSPALKPNVEARCH